MTKKILYAKAPPIIIFKASSYGSTEHTFFQMKYFVKFHFLWFLVWTDTTLMERNPALTLPIETTVVWCCNLLSKATHLKYQKSYNFMAKKVPFASCNIYIKAPKIVL